MYDLVHTLRRWLWHRRSRMLMRDCRLTGTTDSDWIAANVAASAASADLGGTASYSNGAGT